MLVYHNTFVAENSNVRGNANRHYRNNLIMGTDHPERPVLGSLTSTAYTSLDYNGYRSNRNGKPQFVWKALGPGKLRDYSLDGSGYQPFDRLADFRQATGQEAHGIVVDYDTFRSVRPPDSSRPHAVYEMAGVDFNLRPGGSAVDAGCRLPNVNDDFTGRDPDLGALELDRPIPVYGPRRCMLRDGPRKAPGVFC